MPDGIDADLFAALVDDVMNASERIGYTDAFVVVQGGRIIAERYGSGFNRDSTFLSWSMAKSITHAVVGVLVGRGLLDPDAPAPVPEWSAPGDARAAITTEQLLRMTSGLAFVEDYVDDRVSDVIEMLFGAGADDVAGFAASFPLEAEPGTHFSYSSGTSNIVARIAGQVLGGGVDAFEEFLRAELFGPIGMTSAKPRFDAAGTFVGSSYVYATARDFARFATLYLRGGRWDGREVLARSWVDHARIPTTDRVPAGEQRRYGAHWWLWDDPFDTFAAHGYQGQRAAVLPRVDAVIVRLGRSEADQYEPLQHALASISACVSDVIR